MLLILDEVNPGIILNAVGGRGPNVRDGIDTLRNCCGFDCHGRRQRGFHYAVEATIGQQINNG